MLLQEPSESPYDLRFQILGFPVRISWTFWLGAIVIGFDLVQSFDQSFGPESPGTLPLLLLWVGAVFVSILIHELGHALAFRGLGIHSSIVLYHFGGLAIPQSSYVPGRGFARMTPKEDLWVSAAGPVAQMASAAAMVLALKLMNYQIVAFAMLPLGLDRIPGMLDGKPIREAIPFAIVIFYLLPSILWALLNLLPVWPLDGGHITRSVMQLGGGNVEQSLWVSLIAAGIVAAYGFTHHQPFLGIMFAAMALGNYQTLQGGMGPRF
jgi:Zn-dependent protease